MVIAHSLLGTESNHQRYGLSSRNALSDPVLPKGIKHDIVSLCAWPIFGLRGRFATVKAVCPGLESQQQEKHVAIMVHNS